MKEVRFNQQKKIACRRQRRSERRGPHRRRDQGYAMVMVLWTLTLLSLIAAALMTHSRMAARIEANAWARLKAEMIAEAALNRGILTLLETSGATLRPRDGAPAPYSFDGIEVEISLQDELGKLDLNAAGPEYLSKLISAAGLPTADAELLAERILDWRTPAALRRRARIGDYEEAGLPYGPRQAPFQSVDELRLVLGMTDALFERMRPAVTIYSQSAAIDPQIAPALVLRALPYLGENGTNEMLALRAARVSQSNDVANSETSITRVPLNGRAFTISVEIQSDEIPLRIETVVRLTGDSQQPYWALERRRL